MAGRQERETFESYIGTGRGRQGGEKGVTEYIDSRLEGGRGGDQYIAGE